MKIYELYHEFFGDLRTIGIFSSEEKAKEVLDTCVKRYNLDEYRKKHYHIEVWELDKFYEFLEDEVMGKKD